MVELTSLVLPILLSAVLVFIASSLIHMVVGYHKHDFNALPKEDDVQAALRPFGIPPGDYCLPRPGSMADMKNPAYLDKVNKGPVVVMTVMPNGMASMGRNLALWFVFSVLVSFFSAYVAGVVFPPGTPYLKVFQIVGTVTFMAYGFAYIPFSIWYNRSWGTTIRALIDALIYGLLTAGTFGWLWPR